MTPTARDSTARLFLAAMIWSVVCAALGLWWLLDPDAYVLDAGVSDEPTSLMMIVPPGKGSVALLVLGLLGVGLAVALGRTDIRTTGRRAYLAAGIAYGVVFGILVPDIQLLSLLGYALALFGGPILVVILIAGARRSPRNLIALLVIVAAVIVGLLAGEIGRPTLQMLGAIRDGVDRVGLRPLVLVLMLVGGVLFAALTLGTARRGVADQRSFDEQERYRARLQRWGRVATWIAAASPLPYALTRMTWLTPWPQGLPGGEDMLGAGVRVFGVSLGLAALGGALLTLGLIFRWGEEWPAWLPRLRGRPVPVLAAVIPAAVVSVVLCAAAISLVVMSTRDGANWVVFAIPAPIWGPALGVATYAYHRRRTDPQLSGASGRLPCRPSE